MFRNDLRRLDRLIPAGALPAFLSAASSFGAVAPMFIKPGIFAFKKISFQIFKVFLFSKTTSCPRTYGKGSGFARVASRVNSGDNASFYKQKVSDCKTDLFVAQIELQQMLENADVSGCLQSPPKLCGSDCAIKYPDYFFGFFVKVRILFDSF